MNYVEAVKELVNNPKAVAIIFTGRNNQTLKLTRGNGGRLVFFKREDPGVHNFMGGIMTDFILREDFSIEYREEKKYTEKELGNAYDAGWKAGRYQQQLDNAENAYHQFKQDMRRIFDGKK